MMPTLMNQGSPSNLAPEKFGTKVPRKDCPTMYFSPNTGFNAKRARNVRWVDQMRSGVQIATVGSRELPIKVGLLTLFGGSVTFVNARTVSESGAANRYKAE